MFPSHDRVEEAALYFLTFNAPEQLSKQLKIFKEEFPTFFGQCKKYLINNSTDRKHISEYNKIVHEYKLEEHRFDNIGITGGRRFAAEHFHESGHEYMIFFEDDMIMNKNDGICKAGFKKYDKELFKKAIIIMDQNELDYLKLTFAEFFGENFKNWSVENMNESDRKKYLDNTECQRDKTNINYGGSYRNLAYLVGEFFYCNWPILFNKKGNEKVFMNHKISHESGIMANTH